MFPTHVRAVVLDANIDPVAFTTSVEDAIYTSGTDTNLVFEKFLDLCERRAGALRSGRSGRRGAPSAGLTDSPAHRPNHLSGHNQRKLWYGATPTGDAAIPTLRAIRLHKQLARTDSGPCHWAAVIGPTPGEAS